MSGRILLFGATGYTGRLTAEAMMRRGLPVTVVSRSPERVADLAASLANQVGRSPQTDVADAADPRSVRALLASASDVLVSTVGPFQRLGGPACEAAIDAGATLIDCTGESSFIRQVFEEYGPRATATGARLLTAFGYDYVPGNLAGALAIADAHNAGRTPVRLEIGYFVRGAMGMSSGTRASAAGMLVERGHAFIGGRLRSERMAARTTTFDVDGQSLPGLTIGGTEQFTLPRLAPGISDVEVFLGWAGPRTAQASRSAAAVDAVLRVPGSRALARRIVLARSDPTTGRGPDAARRSRSRTLVVARVRDADGRITGSVHLDGPSPYELTADLLTWAAETCVRTGTQGVGALGPIDAFGLAATEAGCAALGLVARHD